MSEPAALRGARAKLARAKAHVNALDAEMDRFMREDDPHRVVNNGDPATGDLVCKVRVNKQPPLEWSLYIGDALQNVRAALDYLACELTILNLGPTADLRRCAYPIFTDRARFEAVLPQRVGGVTPAQRALLERSQPFTKPDPNKWDQLEVLQALSNIDKHRTLNLAWSSLRQIDFPRGVVQLVGEPNFGPLKDGAELARFRGLPHPGTGNVPVRINFAFGVSLTDGVPGPEQPVRTVLGAVHDRVADILDAFTPLLSAE